MGSKLQAVPSGPVLQPGSGQGGAGPDWDKESSFLPIVQQTNGLLSQDKNRIFLKKNFRLRTRPQVETIPRNQIF